ncbi:MAG: hypothetical protein IPI67_41585 [Myxococcales bacterium]|nr:hypothetical protein [Myxococcales bacterium]
MKLRSLLILGVAGSMALTACGSDDSGGGSGGSSTGGGGTGGGSTGGSGGASTGGAAGSSSGGSAGTASGGSAGTASGGSAGSSTGGAAGSSTGGAAGSGTGGAATGGTGGGSGNLTAEAFCASYETQCGFSGTDHFASSGECKASYAKFNAATKDCVNIHIKLVDSKTSVHCGHAAGFTTCNL